LATDGIAFGNHHPFLERLLTSLPVGILGQGRQRLLGFETCIRFLVGQGHHRFGLVLGDDGWQLGFHSQ